MTFVGMLVIGLVVGLLARFLTPGKTQGGILVTIAIGITGSAVATYGGQALGFYPPNQAAGFFGSVIGAVVLLVLVRIVTGR
ncbi:GlsB/YeaQ/YmgE family stress response membrane protein [soil metagenome]